MKRKNIHQRLFCGLIGSLMLASAGCGATGNPGSQAGSDSQANTIAVHTEKQPVDDAATKVDIPAHVTEQLNSKLDVDAEVKTSLDINGTLYSYQAEPDVVDGQKLQEVFFDPEEEVTTDAAEDQVICQSADGSKRASWVKGMYTSFSRMEAIRYLTVISACGDGSALPETLKAAQALPFMDAGKAKELVRDVAGKLEIRLADEPYACFALDEAALRAMYDGAAAALPEGVAEDYLPGVDLAGDAGCYYMLWQQQCPHGEAMMSGNVGLDVKGFNFTMGTYVMAIVNEDGLASFRAGVKYEPSQESELTQIISLEDALNKVKELYQTVPLDRQYHITDITLQYVAVPEDHEAGTYRIVPAWCMETSEDAYRLFVVDAVKGVVL